MVKNYGNYKKLITLIKVIIHIFKMGFYNLMSGSNTRIKQIYTNIKLKLNSQCLK